jgi:hypothetical protein
METPAKKNTGSAALIVTTTIAICLALFALLCAAYLLFDKTKLETGLTAQKAEMAQLRADISSLQSVKQDEIPSFTVASFRISIDYEDSTYIGYTGKGVIASGSKEPCIVIVKATLVSGGSIGADRFTYKNIIVSDGIGTFETYDYGEKKAIHEPVYQFEILGSIKVQSGQ